jgi:hypothetical protein
MSFARKASGFSSVWLVPLSVACAPSQSFRPAGVLPTDRMHEVGLAVSSVGPRPYVDERARPVAEAWGDTRLGEHWISTALLGFDESALFAGGALRFDALRMRHFAASAEAELGFAWAAVSLPLALRFTDRFVAYCSPRLGNWGTHLTGFVPCGLSADIYDGLGVRGEVQFSWENFEYYNRRVHWGLAVTQEW